MHVTRAEHTDLTKEDLLAKANVSIWRRLNTQGSYEDVPLVVFMYLVFTRMPGESYLRLLRSLLLCLCDVFRALITSLVR